MRCRTAALRGSTEPARQGSAVNVGRNARNRPDSTLTALSAVNVEFARNGPRARRCPRSARASEENVTRIGRNRRDVTFASLSAANVTSERFQRFRVTFASPGEDNVGRIAVFRAIPTLTPLSKANVGIAQNRPSRPTFSSLHARDTPCSTSMPPAAAQAQAAEQPLALTRSQPPPAGRCRSAARGHRRGPLAPRRALRPRAPLSR